MNLKTPGLAGGSGSYAKEPPVFIMSGGLINKEYSDDGQRDVITHDVKLQISYSVCTEISETNNLWKTEKGNRRNPKVAL